MPAETPILAAPPAEMSVRATGPDGRGIDLTRHVTNAQCTTAAVGGFGSATITLAGHWTPFHIPWLSGIEITYADLVLFHGQIEDIVVDLGDDGIATTLQAFGPGRALDLRTVRGSWIERGFSDFAAYASPSLAYVQLVAAPSSDGGWRVSGKNVTVPTGTTNTLWSINRGDAVRWQRVMATVDSRGSSNKTGYMRLRKSGNSTDDSFTGEGDAELVSPDPAGCQYIDIGWSVSVSSTFTDSDYVDFEDLRAYGIVLDDEDTATGSTGIFGGRILADLAARVGLTAGDIELGTDFAITQCDASERQTARDVLSQVVPFYQREYRVWENGRLDWVTPTYTDPDWALTLADLDSLTIETSIGERRLKTFVLYTNLALHSGWQRAESSAEATSERNPWNTTRTQADRLLTTDFGLTSSSAPALAAKYATVEDERAAASGRLSLSLDAPITRTDGQTLPAAAIRGGDDIAIIDLPQDDTLTTWRDGQTLFHVAATQINLTDRTINIDIEGQTRRTDVLLARLAAATRVITG